MTESKQCEGYCPRCNSDNLVSGDNDGLTYSYTCVNCGCEFEEAYEKVCLETQYEKEKKDE